MKANYRKALKENRKAPVTWDGRLYARRELVRLEAAKPTAQIAKGGKQWRRDRAGKGISKRAQERRRPPMKTEYGPDTEGMTNHERLHAWDNHRAVPKGRKHRHALRERARG